MPEKAIQIAEKRREAKGKEEREKYVRTLDPKTFPSLSRTLWASLIAQLVKNLPVMQETLVRFLGQEDPLEKG